MTMKMIRHSNQIFAYKAALPAGWQWVKLGDYCQQIDYGYTASANFKIKEPRFLRITDIQNGIVDWDNVPGCEINAQEEQANLLIDGDIVFARTGATTGKSFLIKEPPRAVFASYLIRVRPNSKIHSDFLYTFFQSEEYWKQIRARARGGAQPNVNATLLSEILIPLAPLDEQRRIASRVNEQLTAVEFAREAAEEQLQAAWQLSFAYLREVFEDHKWKSTNLGSLCTIVRGSSPRPKGDPRFYGGKVPRLMVEDVTRDGMYVIPKVDFLTDEGALLSRPMKKGDVVMVVSGAPGLPGILDVDACIHDGFVGFRELQKDKILPEFLYFSLQYYRAENDREATGAIFRNLTTDQVGKFKIPIPPLDVQKETVDKITSKLDSAKELIKALESQLAEINRLPGSLLREAFAGGV